MPEREPPQQGTAATAFGKTAHAEYALILWVDVLAVSSGTENNDPRSSSSADPKATPAVAWTAAWSISLLEKGLT